MYYLMIYIMYILCVLPDDTFLIGHVPMTISAEDSSVVSTN